MTKRTPTPRLELAEPEAQPDPVLERITDPVAREVYRRKLELGIAGRRFTEREAPHG